METAKQGELLVRLDGGITAHVATDNGLMPVGYYDRIKYPSFEPRGGIATVPVEAVNPLVADLSITPDYAERVLSTLGRVSFEPTEAEALPNGARTDWYAA